MTLTRLTAAALTLAACTAVSAQTKSASDGIAEYRKMLEDGNPAELFEAKGENLWKTPRGPKKATLQQCDLGLGPGVVKGAWVQMPRYFADTGRVQDLESRLLSCMETLQGFNAAEIAKTGFDKGEQATLAALAAWISSESRGAKMALPQGHPEERRFYELGKRAFFFRGGPMDFSCASCHGANGEGAANLPRLATQFPGYIHTQLKQFNKRDRTNDNTVMHVVAEKMTELEMAAVAEYLGNK
jgi:sulfur-oxidizing protein SoxA